MNIVRLSTQKPPQENNQRSPKPGPVRKNSGVFLKDYTYFSVSHRIFPNHIEFAFYARTENLAEIVEKTTIGISSITLSLIENLCDHDENEVYRFHSDMERRFLNINQEYFFEFREIVSAYYDSLKKDYRGQHKER